MNNIYKTITYTAVILIFVFITYMFIGFFIYVKDIAVYKQAINDCKNDFHNVYEQYDGDSEIKPFDGVINHQNSCYCKMYNLLSEHLLIYKVKSEGKELEFIRPGAKCYFVPTIILEKADAFIGYEKNNFVEFDIHTSNMYKKNFYVYDTEKSDTYTINYPYLHIDPVPIKPEDFSFEQKLKELNLTDKKVFVKLDIAGAEADIIPDIIKYSANITGIAMVIRCDSAAQIVRQIEMLKMLDKDFILVARNLSQQECFSGAQCKYIPSNISVPIGLTYINKNLADKKSLPFNQEFYSTKNYKPIYVPNNIVPKFTTDRRVTLYKKINDLLNK